MPFGLRPVSHFHHKMLGTRIDFWTAAPPTDCSCAAVGESYFDDERPSGRLLPVCLRGDLDLALWPSVIGACRGYGNTCRDSKQDESHSTHTPSSLEKERRT